MESRYVVHGREKHGFFNLVVKCIIITTAWGMSLGELLYQRLHTYNYVYTYTHTRKHFRECKSTTVASMTSQPRLGRRPSVG